MSTIENRLRREGSVLNTGIKKPRPELPEFQTFATDAEVAGSCWSARFAKSATASRSDGPFNSVAKEAYAKSLDLWRARMWKYPC